MAGPSMSSTQIDDGRASLLSSSFSADASRSSGL